MSYLRNTLSAFVLSFVVPTVMAAPELPDRLKNSEKITYCSGMDSPPLVFFDASQKPTGLAVDFGNAIAARLGDKKVEWRVIPFSGLLPALLASQCDLIVDQLFDKPERREVIDIVNYMNSSQSVVVPKGNPRGVSTLADLAGLKVAVLNGSTIKTLLDAENTRLSEANQKPMKLVVYNTDTDAFQALRIKQADAYGTTVETAGYYQNMAPDLFEEAVPPFSQILTGIGIRKNDTQLSTAVATIIQEMRDDGTYMTLMKKWHVESDALN